MTKIFYITYGDIAIKCDAHGIFTFDTDKIFKNITRRYFTMPKWIKPSVDKVFNDKDLIKAESKEDIRKIINQKVVEINNLVVPVARLNKLNNSEIPDWMGIPKYLDHGDVHVSVVPTYKGNVVVGIQLKVDFAKLIDRVCNDNESVNDDARQELIDIITEYIQKEDGIQNVNPMDFKGIDDEIMKYKDNILNITNEFITRYAEPRLLIDMKDNSGLNPYFAYDMDEEKIYYTEERVLHLLDAMDYAAVDNAHDFVPYIDNHCREVEEELKEALDKIPDEEKDEYLEQNITMSVNLTILNRILFVKNNGIKPDDAVGLYYPAISASQLEIEMVYVDACTEMMTYDILMEDMCEDLDVPKSELKEDVDEMLAEILSTYKLLRDNKEPLDIIYKGVRHTYFDMYDKLVDKYATKSNTPSRIISNFLKMSK